MAAHCHRPTPLSPTPQHHHHHHPSRHNQPRKAVRIVPDNALYLVTFAVCAIFLVPVALIFTSLIILNPPTFQVDSLAISNFNLSSTTPTFLSGNFEVMFTTRNPKKFSLSCIDLVAGIYIGNEQLLVTTLPPFTLPGKKETSIKADFAAVRSYIDDSGKSGNLVFEVRIEMLVNYEVALPGHDKYIEARCPDLSVAFPANAPSTATEVGCLVGGPRHCKVK
ncbi:uncharacterized protein [Coffea arabica]|uniref:Late embryogenesis abundant protein LEA-2 subgroup domain-containing protein n=1 Tax=Coffea arabica TaxID=13443 RepID=A0ABM4WM70_COFAR